MQLSKPFSDVTSATELCKEWQSFRVTHSLFSHSMPYLNITLIVRTQCHLLPSFVLAPQHNFFMDWSERRFFQIPQFGFWRLCSDIKCEASWVRQLYCFERYLWCFLATLSLFILPESYCPSSFEFWHAFIYLSSYYLLFVFIKVFCGLPPTVSYHYWILVVPKLFFSKPSLQYIIPPYPLLRFDGSRHPFVSFLERRGLFCLEKVFLFITIFMVHSRKHPNLPKFLAAVAAANTHNMYFGLFSPKEFFPVLNHSDPQYLFWIVFSKRILSCAEPFQRYMMHWRMDTGILLKGFTFNFILRNNTYVCEI